LIEREFDDATGLILVRGTGQWSFKDVEDHYAMLREMIASVRAGGRPIRILSDVTQGIRQASWVEEYVVDHMSRALRQGDRIAFVVGSDEDRDHLRRLGAVVDLNCFISRKAAQHWLLTDPVDRASPIPD
jgi:hypothetical protein